MNYNLLEEKWIPVLYPNGQSDRVPIRRALEDAGWIRQIAASNPMDRVAILRFLLALLYWCRGNPPDKASAAQSDSFPSDWLKKLDENRECFNLLGDGKRFYQLSSAQRERPATDLLQEVPTGNNFWHFRHSTDHNDGLCPPCCAMGLLRLPLFSVSGLPDLKSGINGSPPVYVLPWGMTLFATLRANWATCKDLGEPAWVKPGISPRPDQDVPLLTGLTLPSRLVWLHEPSEPGACIGCGAKQEALIRKCEFQSAGKQETDRWNDPHVVYSDRTPRKSSKTPDLTAARKFRLDRPWLELLARALEVQKFGLGDNPISLLLVGFATHQAKNIDVWERTIAVPQRTSTSHLTASLLRRWGQEAAQLEKRLKRLTRAEDLGASAIAAIRPHVENSVSAKVPELLAGGDEAWEQAARQYRAMMQIIARSLSPGFTTAALQRRQEIARVMPDMRPPAQPKETPSRKKGDAK